MLHFMRRFPELARRETRTAYFPDDDGEIPPGRYAFIEAYCEKEGCDCRRVLIHVVEESSPGKIWATISFGWDKSRSMLLDEILDCDEATPSGAFLDPMNPQSEYAEEFLDFFENMITRDPAYVERLKRHYAMFKAAQPPKNRPWETPDPTRRAKRPDPKRLMKRKRLS